MAFQIACPDLHFFLPFTHCPPFHSLPRIPVWWKPSAEIGPLQCGGSTLQPGPVTLLSAPPWDQDTWIQAARESSRVRPNPGKQGSLRSSNWVLIQGKLSSLQSSVVKTVPASCGPVFKKETAQWIRMLYLTTSTPTWILYRPKLEKSKYILSLWSIVSFCMFYWCLSSGLYASYLLKL